MNFSEFAKILKPIIGEDKRADEFAYELFSQIVDLPDEKEDLLNDVSPKAYKSYYSGDRGITRFAKKIRKFIEPTAFEAYIDELSEEAQLSIFNALANYVPGMNDQNIAEKTSECFKNIIYDATMQNRRKGGQTKKEGEDTFDIGQKDYYLLDECESMCPICGQILIKNVRGNIKNEYKHLYIMDPVVETSVRLQIEKTSGRKFENNLQGTANQLLVCSNCFDEYYDKTIDDYISLYDIKQNLIKRHRLKELSNEISIEDSMHQILQSFGNINKKTIIQADDLQVYRVDRKIQNNYLLRETVTDMVLKYYLHIEELFKQYERAGKLRFNKVKNEISQCFESLDEQGLSQQEIFDLMVEWLSKQSKCENRIACQVMIAFFVQNCEVFYDIAE